MSSNEPKKEKETKSRKRGDRRSYQRELTRLIDYLNIKIEVLGSLERTSAIEIQIATLKEVLVKAEGK